MRSFPELYVVETVRTLDRLIESAADGGWVRHRVQPPGDGWRVLRDGERHTIWTRRRMVSRPTGRLARRRLL